MGYTKHVLHAVPRALLLVLLAYILLLTGCGTEQSGTEPPKYSELRERYVPYVDNLLIIHSGESPTEEFQQARRLVLAAEELEGYRQFERIKNATEDPLERAHCYNGMGVAMISMSKFRDARALLNRAEELYTQAEGENSVGVGIVAYNFAVMGEVQELKGEIEDRIIKAETIINASYSDTSHPDRLAVVLFKLNWLIAQKAQNALNDMNISDVNGSINQYMTQVKTGLGLAFGPEDMLVRMGENAYAQLLAYQEGNGYLEVKLPRAKEIYEESRKVFSNTLGPEHPQVGTMDYHLAFISLMLNDFDTTTIGLYESAKEIYNKQYGPNYIMSSRIDALLGLLYEETDLKKAKAAYEVSAETSWRVYEAGKASRIYVSEFLSVAATEVFIGEDDRTVEEVMRANYIYINYIDDAEVQARMKDGAVGIFETLELAENMDFETWFAEQLAIVGPEFEAEYEASEKELEAARIYKGD